MISFAVLFSFFLTGCTTTIVPPQNPRNPVTVGIIDYGRHASLALPLGQDASREYEYGEWKWFALNQNQWYRAFPALFWPTQGTLGRLDHGYPPLQRFDLFGRDELPEEILLLEVPMEAVLRLQNALDQRYESNLATAVYNPVEGLVFVKDPARYTFFYNCNHALADWLRELGCEIRGGAFFAKFRIEEPAE